MPDENASVSPEQQQVAVQALVAALGFACEWYVDAEGHRSGLSEEGRPEWLRLKTQLARADVAGIAAYDLSRVYRNTREFLEFVDELEQLEKRIVLVHDLVDTGTAGGRMLATVLVSMYEMEARKTSERVTANIAYKRHSIGQHWGPIPFGCQREKGILSPDPETLYLPHPQTGEPVARAYHGALARAYELFATGEYTYDALAAALNAEGWCFKTRQGAPRAWTVDDARRVMAAWQLYAGDLPLGRLKDGPTEVLKGAHDPLLDPGLCATVGAEVQRRARTYPHKGPNHAYLLTGVLACAECGKPLVGSAQDGRHVYRHHARCKRPAWIDADDFDQCFVAWCEQLDSPAILPAIYEALDALAPTAAQERKTVMRLEKRLQRLAAAYLAGRVSESQYQAQVAQLEHDLATARAAIPADIAAILATVNQFKDLLSGLPLITRKEQRNVMRSLFVRVEVSGNPLADGHIARIVPAEWLEPLWPFIWRFAPEMNVRLG